MVAIDIIQSNKNEQLQQRTVGSYKDSYQPTHPIYPQSSEVVILVLIGLRVTSAERRTGGEYG